MDRRAKLPVRKAARMSTIQRGDLDALYKRRLGILDVGPYNYAASAMMLRSDPVDPRRAAQHAHALQSRR
jgi:hypothetical protein